MAAEGTRIVGRYAIAAEIASGGMATVHLGRLLGPVGFTRNVAIKRLHPHLAKDKQFVAMFVDEARIASRISHPNVVSTLDIVESDGELLVVMDYVEGLSLSTLFSILDGARAPLGIVIALMSDLLQGLDAAHGATSDAGEPLDLIHRDVSPQNVMVGVDGIARIVDFGIAKARGRMQASTLEGSTKGKLRYMSPEQVHGAELTRQTDVYSASIVLWELLTGRRLFAGPNEGNVIEQVLLGDVEAPSRFAPGLPSEVDEVTLLGLQHDLTKRFGTARQMAAALRACAPAASAAEVSAWMQAVAGEALSEVSRRVSAVEGALEVTGLESAPVVREDTEPLPQTPARAVPPVAPASQVTTSSRSRRLATAVALVLVIVGGGLAAASWTGGSKRASTAAKPTDNDGQPELSASASPEIAPAPTAAVAASAEAAAAAAQPRAQSTSQSTSQSPSRPKRPNAPLNAAKAAAVVDCSVPYTVDAEGNKHYKRACLK